jgi:hypothetical protein
MGVAMAKVSQAVGHLIIFILIGLALVETLSLSEKRLEH